jgi:hypothetical protein
MVVLEMPGEREGRAVVISCTGVVIECSMRRADGREVPWRRPRSSLRRSTPRRLCELR